MFWNAEPLKYAARWSTHVCGTDPPAQTHISARCEHTGSMKAVAVSQPFPLPSHLWGAERTGELRQEGYSVGGCGHRAACPTPGNEMDGGDHRHSVQSAALTQRGVCVAGGGGGGRHSMYPGRAWHWVISHNHSQKELLSCTFYQFGT